MAWVNRFWVFPYKVKRHGRFWWIHYSVEFSEEDDEDCAVTVFRGDHKEAKDAAAMLNAAYNLGRQQGYRENGLIDKFPTNTRKQA